MGTYSVYCIQYYYFHSLTYVDFVCCGNFCSSTLSTRSVSNHLKVDEYLFLVTFVTPVFFWFVFML